MIVDGKAWDDTIGWYDPNVAYCINGDYRPGMYEDLVGMNDENEVVELLCWECKNQLSLSG